MRRTRCSRASKANCAGLAPRILRSAATSTNSNRGPNCRRRLRTARCCTSAQTMRPRAPMSRSARSSPRAKTRTVHCASCCRRTRPSRLRASPRSPSKSAAAMRWNASNSCSTHFVQITPRIAPQRSSRCAACSRATCSRNCSHRAVRSSRRVGTRPLPRSARPASAFPSAVRSNAARTACRGANPTSRT